MNTFRITFFGVGGSSSSCSPNRKRYGSNTVCALVEAGEQRVILDMGSGLIPLCASLTASNTASEKESPPDAPIHILLGHYHYDHIEGFPFLKLPHGSHAHIWAEGREGKSPKEILYGFMQTPYFPVTPDIYNGTVDYHEIKQSGGFALSETLFVETIHLNHPGIVTGYKLIYEGKSLVYLLDYEHGTCNGNGNQSRCTEQELHDFCQNADLLIYDAHFTEEEYIAGTYVGWGHSTYAEGAKLANATDVKKLVLSHHANWRSDEELDMLGEAAAKISKGECVMARVGLVISI